MIVIESHLFSKVRDRYWIDHGVYLFIASILYAIGAILIIAAIIVIIV